MLHPTALAREPYRAAFGSSTEPALLTGEPVQRAGRHFPTDTAVRDEARRAFDSHRNFREDLRRGLRYMLGSQLDDVVKDPADGKYKPEWQIIQEQGRTPIINNEIAVQVENLIGTLFLNRSEPTPFAVGDDDDAKAAVMGAALKGVFNTNRLRALEGHQMRQLIAGGREIYRMRYGFHPAVRRSDVRIDAVDPERFAINPDSDDPRGFDIRLMVELVDLTFDEVAMLFGTDAETGALDMTTYEALKNVYAREAMDQRAARSMLDKQRDKHRTQDVDFLTTEDPAQCRLIWVWKEEHVRRGYINDPETGETSDLARPAIPMGGTVAGQPTATFQDAQQEAEMLWIQRLDQYAAEAQAYQERAASGMAYEVDEMGQVLPILPPMAPQRPTAIERYEPVWIGRALSPQGDVLWMGPSPYKHGQPPYVVGDRMRINGNTRGFIADIIDPQRQYNRINQILDFLFGRGAKGGVAYDRGMIDEDEHDDSTVSQARASGEAIGVKPAQGKTVRDFWVEGSTVQAPAWLMQWMDRSRESISAQSGLNPATMGDAPAGDTSGFSYQLQQVAASTNVRGLFEAHFETRRNVALRAMQLIAQFYDTPRQIRVTGRSESVVFEPDQIRDIAFDMSAADVAETATSALVGERRLQEFLMGQFISFEEFLEVSGDPLAPQLKALVQQRAPELLAMPGQEVAASLDQAAQAAGVPTAPTQAQQAPEQYV